MNYLWEVIVIIIGLIEIIIAGIFIEHFTKFRPGLAEKFMLKEDCLRQMETRQQEINRLDASILQRHEENREDHNKIFDELKKLNDSFNKQFISVIKCLNKLNGEKEGNA